MTKPSPTPAAPLPHVVIVGGGFGGLNAAKALKGKPVRITLIDRHNYHLFAPLLYQVATATLSDANVAVPIRSVLRKQENLSVLMGEVTTIDLADRQVRLADGERIVYDYLIVAAGASHSYFGHDEWAAVAPGLKDLDDAFTIRRRILSAYERAERERDPAQREALLTFAIVGGGPTGVELAGAIAEIAHHTLAREFAHIDPAQTRIVLFEAQDDLLATYPEKLRRRTRRDLERLGVSVRTGTRVTGVDGDGVTIGDERVRAATVIWAAGVQASPITRALAGAGLDRTGRVMVAPDLSLRQHPEVFVVGDAAALTDGRGAPLPGVAQVAIQTGTWAGRNILRLIAGESPRPFRYRNLGNMATIGRNRAVVDMPHLAMTGFVAWLAWAGLHILKLVGYRNRVLVALQWLLAYVTFHRGARLITGEQTVEQGHAPAQAGTSAVHAPNRTLPSHPTVVYAQGTRSIQTRYANQEST